MCSKIESGEKGYKLPEQILFNSLVLFPTLIPAYSYQYNQCDMYTSEQVTC